MTRNEERHGMVGRRTLLRGGTAALAATAGYSVLAATQANAAGRPAGKSVAAAYGDVITPLDFGAVGDGVANDTAALQAAFEYWLSTASVVTLDLAGRSYLISAGLKVPAVQFATKRLTNGRITAAPDFVTTDYILDFETGLAATLSGLSLDNLELVGGPWHDPAYAAGGILLGRTQGVEILHNRIRGFSVACIKCTDPHAATEIRIAFNVISGQNDGNPDVRGIEFAGYDSDIESNIIRGCGVCIYLHQGANTIIKNHLYTFSTPAQYGIICANSGNLLINDNSIDNLTVRLVAPQGGIRISGNQFKVKASMPGAPVSIELAPQSANAELVDVAITGNTFWAPSGEFDAIQVDETAGAFDPNSITRCSVMQNTFENIVERTSNPSRTVAFTAATQGTADFASGTAGALPAFGQVRRVRGLTQEISSGPGAAIWHEAAADNKVLVTTASPITGTVSLVGSINTEDV